MVDRGRTTVEAARERIGVRIRIVALAVLASASSILAAGAGVGGSAGEPVGADPAWPTAVEAIGGLGPGVNIGNALEAPTEGAWGVTITPALLDAIVAAGFTTVRLPVKWSAHAGVAPPYTIDPAFAARIDEVLDGLTARGLHVVLDLHHYDEIHTDPAGHHDRFVALWEQIATRYASQPASVWFELLNEPTGALDPPTWNALVADTLAAVRATNPGRNVVVDSTVWSRFDTVDDLVLPAGDPHLVASFHYYLPFRFTHQGAGWVPGSGSWLGTRWLGTDAERTLVRDQFQVASAWSAAAGVPVWLGEFGAYEAAPYEDRVHYTAGVARQAEACGIPWSYWEFASGFGVWDPTTGDWLPELRDALTGADPDSPLPCVQAAGVSAAPSSPTPPADPSAPTDPIAPPPPTAAPAAGPAPAVAAPLSLVG